ncbi:hypothetical protein HMN09_00783600 [Mycena chlorophos]|uniref:Uncharacterized protein n=1 Tax=Mycena chlorophos TaxID=658473 RepID=A0A8H6SU59_MYCCL|nr:hypothetical protein HMN09_00783600 [Mycena chlorophos]
MADMVNDDRILLLQPVVSAFVNKCQQPDSDPGGLLRNIRMILDASGPDAKARSIELVGVEGCAMLMGKLPWELVMPLYVVLKCPALLSADPNSVYSFAQLLEDDASNLRRQQLCRRFRELRVDEDWLHEQEKLALRSSASLQVGDIPWLLQLLEESGEEESMQSVFPQLAVKNPSQYFWLSLMARLQQSGKSALSKKCLDIVVRQLPPFPEHTTCYPPNENMSGPDNLVKIARICVETDDTDKLLTVFAKMQYAIRTRSAPETTFEYYYPLAEFVLGLTEEQVADSRLSRESLNNFLLDVLDSFLDEQPVCKCVDTVFTNARHWQRKACPIFNDENTAKILRVAGALGGVHFLQYSRGFSVDALKKHHHMTVKDFARAVALNAKPERVDDPAYASYDSVVSSLLDVHPPAEDKSSLTDFLKFFELALQLGAHTAVRAKLEVLSTEKMLSSHTIQLLLPLTQKLAPLLRQYRPRLLDEAFHAFAHAVFKSFSNKLRRFRLDIFSTLVTFDCEVGSMCPHGCPDLRKWIITGGFAEHEQSRVA